MPTFRFNRPLFGDYGPDNTKRMVNAGELVTVSQFQADQMKHLEEEGLIERFAQGRKAFTGVIYQNKALKAPVNK